LAKTDIGQSPRKPNGSRDESEKFFRELLAFEIATAGRYQRSTTVVAIAPMQLPIDPVLLVRDHFRKSDLFFKRPEQRTAVLMRETRPDGARMAIERVKRQYDGQLDLRISLASYPEDGENAGEIMRALERRLLKARKGDRGDVIDQE
jgi:hypothetical protein